MFLAALMILSVFAMSVSFAGAAAAQVESEANAQFDQSTYSEEAGDIAEFTVEMENTDSAQVELVEANNNYNATLDVTDADGDGEVTVYFNTHLAGEDDQNAFYTAENSNDTVSVTVNEDNTGDSRLLPADFTLQLYVGEDDAREEVDVATLTLTEGSISAVATGVAPSDATLESVEDITTATTEGNEVATGDNLVVAFKASGVFGAIDVGEFEDHFNVVLEQTNDQYDDGVELTADDYQIVEDPENDRFFIVLNTNDLEAGGEYELTLEPATGDNGIIDSLYFIDDEEYKKGSGVIVSTEFNVVERMIEVTGDFDDEDRLLVPNSEEATVTGESNAAPGTDVRVQLRATGEDPFLMSQTVEVQEDGSVEATFDLSDHQVDQEFTVTMIDGDVQDQVNAILIESADDDRHSDDKKGDEKKGDEKKGDEKKGDEKKGDEKQDNGDEKKGDEKQDNGDENGDDNNEQPGSGPDEDQPGFGIIVALVALLAAAGFALRRQ
ncbi:BGTF surface domain-containing protein [Halalkalicoccus sp. GCM10025322]|uniref:BGTF surface domain-containing protein n=1 Tax=Halalkalicoccus sp. GCM10025322 TaxID=3252661 RepID=UPI00360A5D0C